ncbi:trans-sulfuration enzyme family protein [Actinocorallia aurea]
MTNAPVDSPHTLAVHAGQSAPEDLPSPPLSVTAAIPLESVEHGWEQLTRETVPNTAYQRYANRTVGVLEEKFARLEGAEHCLAFNSGMSACYATFRALTAAGDHIVTQHALYHEISDQFLTDVRACGVDVTFVTDYSVESFTAAMTERTRLVFVETPTNPVLLDVPIGKLAEACHERGVILVVDNTLLTPVYQQPLRLGADVTVYSTTKNINGHGDAMGGMVCSDDSAIAQRLATHREYTGSILDPFSAWLTLRGMRTLPLRLDRHSTNASTVVELLRRHYPRYPVATVLDTPQARTNQIAGATGVFALTLPSREHGTEFLRRLRLVRIATTFGNLESLAYHFGTFARPTRDLSKIGLDYGLVRISVGIEDPHDVFTDIATALDAMADVLEGRDDR